jgi:oligopeptide transport system ATP-binding protein
MAVGEIIEEPLKIHNIGTNKERRERVNSILKDVGLSPEYFNRYPHQLSGGQRQRVGIARSLPINPSFIVCDEPISSLDVSIQSQIVNLLKDLQEKLNLTYLFIAHDISIVKQISDKIAVMYLGKIVELTFKDEFYENPLHPYTKALISAIPVPDPGIERKREKLVLKEEISKYDLLLKGCRFYPRCNLKNEFCEEKEPELKEISQGHYVACHNI